MIKCETNAEIDAKNIIKTESESKRRDFGKIIFNFKHFLIKLIAKLQNRFK